MGWRRKEAFIISALCTSIPCQQTKIIAQSGAKWDELFADRCPGFHHSVLTMQSLHTAETGDSRGQVANTLIPMFTVHGMYAPSKIDLSLGDSTLSVTDLGNIHTFHRAIILFVRRLKTKTNKPRKIVIFNFNINKFRKKWLFY
jgi:hypothetical protein